MQTTAGRTRLLYSAAVSMTIVARGSCSGRGPAEQARPCRVAERQHVRSRAVVNPRRARDPPRAPSTDCSCEQRRRHAWRRRRACRETAVGAEFTAVTAGRPRSGRLLGGSASRQLEQGGATGDRSKPPPSDDVAPAPIGAAGCTLLEGAAGDAWPSLAGRTASAPEVHLGPSPGADSCRGVSSSS